MADIKDEQIAEALAMLKILEMGQQQIKEGKCIPAKEAIDRIRRRRDEMDKKPKPPTS